MNNKRKMKKKKKNTEKWTGNGTDVATAQNTGDSEDKNTLGPKS
jgi:hypothetical protein